MLPKIDPALIGARLGEGCSGCVYEYGKDRALKLAIDDGTRDYMEWCYARGRRYGRRSPEMANLPWVYTVGPLTELPVGVRGSHGSGWYALMERYDSTLEDHMQWGRTRGPMEVMEMPALAGAVRSIQADLGFDATCDMDSRNVMWSHKRGELVITDPSSGSYSGSFLDTVRRLSAPIVHIELRYCPSPVASRSSRAQWKLPPLQQQFHMRVQ